MSKLLQIGSLGAWLAIIALGAGCGGGFDTEEATEVCDDIEMRQTSCLPAAARTQCISCFEECGRACAQLESCPLQFSCE